MSSPHTEIKRYAMETIVRDFGRVFVVVNPRVEGVIVPPSLIPPPDDPHSPVLFDVILDGVIPITDLDINDDGWSATMSIGRQPHHCTLPWDSVIGMHDIEKTIFVHAVATHQMVSADARAKKTEPKKASHLKVVK